MTLLGIRLGISKESPGDGQSGEIPKGGDKQRPEEEAVARWATCHEASRALGNSAVRLTVTGDLEDFPAHIPPAREARKVCD